jgi:hypothetical protein
MLNLEGKVGAGGTAELACPITVQRRSCPLILALVNYDFGIRTVISESKLSKCTPNLNECQ